MMRYTTISALTLMILCLANSIGFCQSDTLTDNRPRELEAFIKELVMRDQFNGNILIAEKGEVIYERAIGQRSAIPGDTLELGTQFRLASACGPITALAIMQLEESGLISYDDLVEKHIPDWPYQGRTIRNLLNETSGFPNLKDLTHQYWKPDLRQDDTARLIEGNERVIKLFIEHSPEPRAKPGESYQHNSLDYILLATIVERVSGIPFHQYMREKVYLPAGMSDTYNFSPLREDPLANRAYGIMVSMDGAKLISRDFDYLQSLAGFGIYSTLRDLFRLDRALTTDLLVSQKKLKAAFTPGTLNNSEKTKNGFGWSLHAEGHSTDGYSAGFGVWINRDIGEQNTIIILTNRNIYLWGGIIQGVKKILKGEDYELPKLDGSTLVGRTLLTKGEKAARAQYEDFKNQSDKYDLGCGMGLQSLGHFLAIEGYNSEAMFAYRLNTEQYPDVAWVWNWLGDGYLSMGDTTNAIATYNKALTIDTSLAPALQKLQMLQQR